MLYPLINTCRLVELGDAHMAASLGYVLGKEADPEYAGAHWCLEYRDM